MCEIFDLSDSDLSLRPVLQGNRLQCCVQGGVGMRVGPSSTWGPGLPLPQSLTSTAPTEPMG